MIDDSNAFVLERRKTAAEKLFKAIFHKPKAMMNDGAAELGMLQGLIPKGSTTIDVGANVGEFSRRLSEISEGGLVLAIEPQSMPRAVLTMAGYFKRRSNILVIATALGRTSGLVELTIPIKSKGKVGIGLAHTGENDDLQHRFEVKKELVCQTTLDELIGRVNSGPVSFVKIDVEGGEYAVLEGATCLIEKHRPAVLCEIDNRETRHGDTVMDLVSFFKDRDYVPCRVTDLSILEFDRLEKNTVFVPREKLQ